MVLLNIFCAAQDTANSKGKLVSEDAHWTNITTDRWDSSYVKIDNFNIKGDTTVNAHEYLKVYLNNELYAGLREDEDHKVYAHFFLLDTQQYKQEYLLYDFSWQLGDTLSYEPVWADTLMHAYVIDSLDSIKLDDQSYYECIPLGGDITLIKKVNGIIDYKNSLGHNYKYVFTVFYDKTTILIYPPDIKKGPLAIVTVRLQ